MSPTRKPTAAEIAAAPPPPPGATTGPKPIGVPEGYVVDRPEFVPLLPGQMGPPTLASAATPPRYFDGDEWGPASLSAEDRARLQRAMVDAGVITKGTKFRLGIWDDASRGAYADLLAFANGAGLDARSALAEYARMAELYDDEERAGRAPLVVRQSNPDDLRATFETVARRRMGRKLRPDEAERFVKAYQAEEATVQTQAYGAAETGGVVTDAPDPQAFLAAKLAREYGVEVGATAIAEQGNEFFQLLDEVGG